MDTNGFFQTVDIYTKENQKFLLHSQTRYIGICRQWQTQYKWRERKITLSSKIIPVHFDIRINLDTSGSPRAFDTRAKQKRARNMAPFWARRQNELHTVHTCTKFSLSVVISGHCTSNSAKMPQRARHAQQN
jgi:hypothetical protein